MSYTVTFTELAKAAAEASSSLAAVEAKARAEVINLGFGVDETLPPWGFHTFEMPDDGEHGQLEIDTIERRDSLGQLEDRADGLGVTGDVSFPVRATKK